MLSAILEFLLKTSILTLLISVTVEEDPSHMSAISDDEDALNQLSEGPLSPRKAPVGTETETKNEHVSFSRTVGLVPRILRVPVTCPQFRSNDNVRYKSGLFWKRTV